MFMGSAWGVGLRCASRYLEGILHRGRDMSTRNEHILSEFRHALAEHSLHEALGVLNRTTEFRFTGVYRFEKDLVVNVVLFDRQNPALRIGEDVRLNESYCRYTALAGDRYTIEDSASDPRLLTHAAREAVMSYGAVLLTDEDGSPLGTLCHFDVCPRPLTVDIYQHLALVRPDVERAVRERRGIPDREPGVFQIANFAGRSTSPST